MMPNFVVKNKTKRVYLPDVHRNLHLQLHLTTDLHSPLCEQCKCITNNNYTKN